jgi:hypothetical protein
MRGESCFVICLLLRAVLWRRSTDEKLVANFLWERHHVFSNDRRHSGPFAPVIRTGDLNPPPPFEIEYRNSCGSRLAR